MYRYFVNIQSFIILIYEPPIFEPTHTWLIVDHNIFYPQLMYTVKYIDYKVLPSSSRLSFNRLEFEWISSNVT